MPHEKENEKAVVVKKGKSNNFPDLSTGSTETNEPVTLEFKGRTITDYFQSSMPGNYYKILGVEENASLEEIKKAYKVVSLYHHPDKNKHREAAAQTLFQKISEAYEVLSDPKRRQEYDLELKQNERLRQMEEERAKAMQIYEKFKSFAIPVLEAINPQKRDIPIEFEDQIYHQYINVGESGPNYTSRNLTQTEQSEFEVILRAIQQRLQKEQIESRSVRPIDFDDRFHSSTMRTECSIDIGSLSDFISVVNDEKNLPVINSVLEEMKTARNCLRYFKGKFFSDDSLLKCDIISNSNGEIKIRISADYNKIENSDHMRLAIEQRNQLLREYNLPIPPSPQPVNKFEDISYSLDLGTVQLKIQDNQEEYRRFTELAIKHEKIEALKNRLLSALKESNLEEIKNISREMHEFNFNRLDELNKDVLFLAVGCQRIGAIKASSLDILKYLIEEAGCDINKELKVENEKSTVFVEAAKYASLESIEYLYEKMRPDLNAKYIDGETVLHNVMRKVPKIVVLPAELNLAGTGEMEIGRKKQEDYLKRVDFLIKHGASLSVPDSKGVTPLDIAKERKVDDKVLLFKQNAQQPENTIHSILKKSGDNRKNPNEKKLKEKKKVRFEKISPERKAQYAEESIRIAESLEKYADLDKIYKEKRSGFKSFIDPHGRKSRKDMLNRLSTAIDTVTTDPSTKNIKELKELMTKIKQEIKNEQNVSSYKLGRSSLEKIINEIEVSLNNPAYTTVPTKK